MAWPRMGSPKMRAVREDAEEELVGDLGADGGIFRAGDDLVVVDAALAVDEGLDDDGGVVAVEDGTGHDGGVEIVGRGEGAEGLVVGHDGIGDGDHSEQEEDSADEGGRCRARPAEALDKDGADGVAPLEAEAARTSRRCRRARSWEMARRSFIPRSAGGLMGPRPARERCIPRRASNSVLQASQVSRCEAMVCMRRSSLTAPSRYAENEAWMLAQRDVCSGSHWVTAPFDAWSESGDADECEFCDKSRSRRAVRPRVRRDLTVPRLRSRISAISS